MGVKQVIYGVICGCSLLFSQEKLSLGCDIWEPYQYLDSTGRVDGFCVRLVQRVFEKIFVEVESVATYPWARAILMVQNGSIDALFSVNFTDERNQTLYYPEEPLTVSSWIFWSREEDSLQINSLDDLRGLRVGVVRGYSYTDSLWIVLKEIGYDAVTTDVQNFLKLHSKRVDVIIAEEQNSFSVLKKKGLRGIVAHRTFPVKRDGLYIVFYRSVPEDIVRRFSDELRLYKSSEEFLLLRQEFLH